MAKIFLDSAEQGIVVFKVWKSLAYKKRLLLSSVLILGGLFLQFYFMKLIPGVVLVFAGNLFLLPSGYDNRVKLGKYNPKAGWEQIGEHKLQEFLKLEKNIRKWDRSSIDISNGLGFFTFLLLAGVLGFLFLYSLEEGDRVLQMLAVNGAVLFIPHWFFGMRSIFTIPHVSRKIKLILGLLGREEVQAQVKRHDLDYFALLKGEKTKVPDDVKFRVEIENRHKDFLGYYGQVVMNSVQSTPYPYFYVVLVAKRGFGLNHVYRKYTPDLKLLKEYKVQSDVEVLVIRQDTRITRGYFTPDKQVYKIFLEGLKLAETAALPGDAP
ncbi:MAG: hypothetical protein KAW12_24060, partial [Candidatus Aminicenantes bacterium]|nr:hypothetical protein [Candidatus Aminicenantes bacterium]